MPNTCAYRAAATDAAAKAIRLHYLTPIKSTVEPWESITEDEREYYRELFRVGHREYRRVVREEG